MHNTSKDIVAKHDDCDVHKVVCDQNRCQCSLRVFPQQSDAFVPNIFLCIQLCDVGDKLKNAISEPLANPDTNNKPTTNTIATATPKDGGKTYISDKVSVI